MFFYDVVSEVIYHFFILLYSPGKNTFRESLRLADSRRGELGFPSLKKLWIHFKTTRTSNIWSATTDSW